MAQQDQSADLIVKNAKVWTGDGPPSTATASPRAPDLSGTGDKGPEPTAFAVRDGRFVYVGDEPGVAAWRGPKTQIVDAAGARVVPGLTDAHLHLISGGLQLSRIDLRGASDRAAFIRDVAERTRTTPAGEWVLGGRWTTESWADTTQPTKEWIDAVTPDNPVLLSRMDGHSALANSVALKLAGIDRNGPADPPGGKIARDPQTKEPTGILKETAVDLVSRLVPEDSPAEQDRALAAAVQEAHRHGITMVHTMSPWSRVAAMSRARDEGRLTLRIREFVSEDDWAKYIDRVKRFASDDRLRIVGFKQFMDGSLGSRTAYMAEPFADNPPYKPDEPRASARAAVRPHDWRGILMPVGTKEGELERLCKAADAAGYGCAIHAIGDQANHLVLDAYEATIKANGPISGRRLRIEHAQHLLPDDITRFAALGVIASMQPLHKADDGRYAEKAIGPERCHTSYAYRSLLDAGASVAFGSDWPVVTLNPFKGIHAAVTGKTLDGRIFVPEQNITVAEALRCYTLGGAYAAGDQERLGRIKAGYLADFVILSKDILSTSLNAIATVSVKQTWVNGVQVWPTE